MNLYFQCGYYRFALSGQNRPLVMGILNVTPDSFSDGGQFDTLNKAVAHAEKMIQEGVDIIDIGGESSRPGAIPLSLEEEKKRVLPILKALQGCGKPLSIDTYKPTIMAEAVASGADMLNDISGFVAKEAIAILQQSQVGACIMHMRAPPSTMQITPYYDEVVQEVTGFLKEQVEVLLNAGIAKQRLCIDPGFGFGKTLEHNLSLLRGLKSLQKEVNLPVLAGLSRKAMIGELTGKAVDGRLAGSLAAALFATTQGAAILRVHDVAATVDALKVWGTLTQD